MRIRLLTLATISPLAVCLTTACHESTAVTPPDLTVMAQTGGGQTDSVTGTLPTPLSVLVTNTAGTGVPNVEVDWVASDGPPLAVSTVTDANGVAQFQWTLGITAGVQTATATVSGVRPVVFAATATAGVPREVLTASEDAQSAPHGTTLPAPLVVEVVDQYSNPVPNTTVTWTVASGGGTLSTGTTSGATVTATTGADGLAHATWTIGGVGSNTVTATISTPTPHSSVTFSTTGL